MMTCDKNVLAGIKPGMSWFQFFHCNHSGTGVPESISFKSNTNFFFLHYCSGIDIE